MDATKRAMINVSGLNILGLFEGIGGCLIRAFLRTVEDIRRWNRVQKDSRALLNMSDHMLKDIGLSREDVLHAAGKELWWR
jgi:uncharacterized protein YjiS (DUF1127 family)